MAEKRSNSMSKEDAPAYDEGQASAAPPAYSSLSEAVEADMNSLRVGDPQETVNVPMVHSHEQKRKRDLINPITRAKPTITRTVVVRKMTREHYLKHYAKDSQGNFIGTDKPAIDSGLVFVPGKSSDEELMEQVRKVAFGKEHHAGDFGLNGVGIGMAYGGAY